MYMYIVYRPFARIQTEYLGQKGRGQDEDTRFEL